MNSPALPSGQRRLLVRDHQSKAIVELRETERPGSSRIMAPPSLRIIDICSLISPGLQCRDVHLPSAAVAGAVAGITYIFNQEQTPTLLITVATARRRKRAPSPGGDSRRSAETREQFWGQGGQGHVDEPFSAL